MAMLAFARPPSCLGKHRRAPEVSPRFSGPRESLSARRRGRGTAVAMSGGMNKRRDKAGLVLGAVFLMIPARWASAAEALPAAPAPATVEASTPRDEPWSPSWQ